MIEGGKMIKIYLISLLYITSLLCNGCSSESKPQLQDSKPKSKTNTANSAKSSDSMLSNSVFNEGSKSNESLNYGGDTSSRITNNNVSTDGGNTLSATTFPILRNTCASASINLPVSRFCSDYFVDDMRVPSLVNTGLNTAIRMVPKNVSEPIVIIPSTQNMVDGVINNAELAFDFSNFNNGEYYAAFCARISDKDCAGMYMSPSTEVDRSIQSGFPVVFDNCRVSSFGMPGFDRIGVLLDRGDRDNCDNTTSPLIIDFSNTGIVLSSPLSGVNFDIDSDGTQDHISWTEDSSAGFLVLDKNNNGKIDDGNELFGNNSTGPDGRKAPNGFLALRKYDSNSDGMINSDDSIYSELMIWFDENRDGISEIDELHSLSSVKVKSINLNYLEMNEHDIYGNQTKQRSLIIMDDGTEKVIFDIWFQKVFGI